MSLRIRPRELQLRIVPKAKRGTLIVTAIAYLVVAHRRARQSFAAKLSDFDHGWFQCANDAPKSHGRGGSGENPERHVIDPPTTAGADLVKGPREQPGMEGAPLARVRNIQNYNTDLARVRVVRLEPISSRGKRNRHSLVIKRGGGISASTQSMYQRHRGRNIVYFEFQANRRFSSIINKYCADGTWYHGTRRHEPLLCRRGQLLAFELPTEEGAKEMRRAIHI